MGWIVAIAVLGGLGCLLLALLDPRAVWQRTTAWSYRNPEAVEPSDAAFAASRITHVVLGLLLLGMAGWLWNSHAHDTRDITPLVQQVATELRTDGDLPAGRSPVTGRNGAEHEIGGRIALAGG